MAANGIELTVTGRAVYTDANGDQGIPGVKVSVCEDDGIAGRQCVTTITAGDGDFTVHFVDVFELDSSLEIYVEIRADSPGASVHSYLSPLPYCYRSKTVFIDGATHYSFGHMAPLDNLSCGSLIAPLTDSRDNAGFYIFKQLNHAFEYMNSITIHANSAVVPKVTARLIAASDNTDTPTSSYSSSDTTIKVQPYTWDVDSERGFQTIFHEYGHHLLHSFAESPAPDYDNGNCD
ncbi:MAG: hypothetical protein QF357_07775, partial [Dehalococcoidia bacterium]|nr:hypothetical protein [Dehalococcoidia bacterium]